MPIIQQKTCTNHFCDRIMGEEEEENLGMCVRCDQLRHDEEPITDPDMECDIEEEW